MSIFVSQPGPPDEGPRPSDGNATPPPAPAAQRERAFADALAHDLRAPLRSIDSFNAIRQQLGITAQVGVSTPGIYSIDETTLAGYAMAKYGFDLGSVLGVVPVHIGVEGLDQFGIGDGVRRLVQTSSADDDCAHGTPGTQAKTPDFATFPLRGQSMTRLSHGHTDEIVMQRNQNGGALDQCMRSPVWGWVRLKAAACSNRRGARA